MSEQVRILVVDDEADVRVFLTTVLEDAGAEVIIDINGLEAIDRRAFNFEYCEVLLHGLTIIDGNAELAGTLAVTLTEGFQPSAGTTFRLLTAKRVQGSFANGESNVTAGAVRFKIGYSDDTVTLTVQ